MQFLLLISALLSAVTGAFAGPRLDARAVQAHAQQVAGAEETALAEVVAQRPPAACAPLAAPAPIPSILPVPRKVPLDTDCLRE